MRVVFMGTPEAAVPTLRALNDAHDIAAVYTRPDKPKGRGRQLEASPVKIAATELGLEVRQPARLRDETDAVAALKPDAIVVVAYGAILKPDLLAVPRLGCVNVHFSLLPRWRGAAPVERAIEAGDEQTGVATMLMDEGLDTGAILLVERTPIAADDTAATIRSRLADIGAPLLLKTLTGLEDETIRPVAQTGDATYAEKVTPDEALLDAGQPAIVLERKIRAFDPAPGAFLFFRGKRLKVWKAKAIDGDGARGTFIDGAVQTSDGRLALVEVQPEGKRRMSGLEFINGYRPADGEPVG